MGSPPSPQEIAFLELKLKAKLKGIIFTPHVFKRNSNKYIFIIKLNCGCLLSFVPEINVEQLPFNHFLWMAAERSCGQIGFKSKEEEKSNHIDFLCSPFCPCFSLSVLMWYYEDILFCCTHLRWFGIRSLSYSTCYVAWWDSISLNQRTAACVEPHNNMAGWVSPNK